MTTETSRIVLLGEGGVGKTAITIKLCLNHFVETYDPTIEDSYRKQVVIDGKPVTLEILDTAGQEEYLTLTDQWIVNGDAFLIVYSLIEKDSFQNVGKYFEQIVRVKDIGEPPEPGGQRRLPPILIAGNKLDLAETGMRMISEQDGQRQAIQLGCEFLETSAKNGTNVEKAFFTLVRMVRDQHSGSKKNKAQNSNPNKRQRRICTIL